MRRNFTFVTLVLLFAGYGESSRVSVARLQATTKHLQQLKVATTSGVDPEKQKKVLTVGVSLATALISCLGEDGEIDFDDALQSLSLQGWKLIVTIADADTNSEQMQHAKEAWKAGIALLRSWLADFKDWSTGRTPNYPHAIASAQTEGWKIVKFLSSDPNSQGMKDGKRAWDRLFGDLDGLRELLQNAVNTGDRSELINAIEPTLDTALRVFAEALPDKAVGFNAVADLINGLTYSWTTFSKKVESLDKKGESLIQVTGVVSSYVDSEKLNQLLTVGVGILTSLITAVDQDPIDFEYLFDSLKVQGWRMATLILPEQYQKGNWIKKAKQAWERVFSSAKSVAEHATKAYKEGDVMALVNTAIMTVDTGLRTVADVSTEDARGDYLTAVADLWSGVGGSVVQLSLQMEWLKPVDEYDSDSDSSKQ